MQRRSFLHCRTPGIPAPVNTHPAASPDPEVGHGFSLQIAAGVEWPQLCKPVTLATARMSEQQITVFTDGASKGNPGPGGWGVIIATPHGHVTELGGGAAVTTNNKMELTAAIEALSRLQGTSGPVSIHTDSTYVIQGIREWVHGWKRRGWKTAAGTDVLNRGLWEQLDSRRPDDHGEAGPRITVVRQAMPQAPEARRHRRGLLACPPRVCSGEMRRVR